MSKKKEYFTAIERLGMQNCGYHLTNPMTNITAEKHDGFIITNADGGAITEFTGSLLIETIFSLDGLGLLSYESVLKRDYPVVLGTLYLFTLLGLFAKLMADISYVLIDPRIHFESVD